MKSKTNQQDFESLLKGLPTIHSISNEREQLLANAATDEAREELILGHMREAFCYIRRCCRAKIPDDEILSISYKALVECARNFKPGMQRFFAYSKANLRGNISRHWNEQDVVKNSTANRTPFTDDWLSRNGEEETECDIQPIESVHVDPEFDRIELNERLRLIQPIIKAKLNEQEQMVIDLFYNGGFSFEKIGELLTPRVTRSAVQQTHARAIKKLQAELARRKITS